MKSLSQLQPPACMPYIFDTREQAIINQGKIEIFHGRSPLYDHGEPLRLQFSPFSLSHSLKVFAWNELLRKRWGSAGTAGGKEREQADRGAEDSAAEVDS